MTEVVLTFNNRSYRLTCAPAEEERLAKLAEEVKTRLDALLAEHGPVGNERLLLMAALELADALHDLKIERGTTGNAATLPAPASHTTSDALPSPRRSAQRARKSATE